MGQSCCIQCQVLVIPRRKSSGTQLAGLALAFLGLFVFWPLTVAGVLMMVVFGSAKRVCPGCGTNQLVPSDSMAGRRIMEAQLDERTRQRLNS